MLYVNLTTPEQSVKIKTPFFSEAIRDYLLRIGVPENLSRIKLSNKEDSPIRITLSGETEYDRHLAKIFSPLNSLFELNMTIQTLEDLDLRIKDNITNNILKDKYHSLRELRQGLRSEFLSLGDVSEVFYFPISGIIYFDDDCRYYDIASAEELLNNEDVIMVICYHTGADGKPEIIPEEAEIIRNIFDMFLAGATAGEIADKLLAGGIRSKCGKQKWSVSTIQRILRNEKYCGDAILQKTVTVDCISKTVKKNTGEAPMYYVRNNHTPIVTREVFNRAQEELARRGSLAPVSSNKSVTSKGKYSRYALTNLVYCDECGAKYRRVTWANKYGKKIVWRCVNRIENGTKYCKHSPSIAEEELKSAVVQEINELCQNSPDKYLELLNTTLYDAIGLNEGRTEIDLLTARIEAINQQILDLMNESLESGSDLFSEGRESEFAELSAEIDQLSKRIEAIKESAFRDESSVERVKELQVELLKHRGGISEYDESVARSLVDRVVIHQNREVEVVIKNI